MANFFTVSKKKTVKTDSKKTLTVNIERLDFNGCGVAYVKNKPIFIHGTLPNENVDIKVVEQKNKYTIAKLLTVNTANHSRVNAKCQHFKLCGGCDIQHLEYSEQLNFKKNKIIELFSRANIAKNIIIDLPWQAPIVSSPWGYRRKARIGVQFDKNSQATIGFRQKSTNQLVAIKSCPVLIEPAAEIFPLLKELISKLSVKKSIGHIEIIGANFTQSENDKIDSTQVDNLSGSVNKLTLIIRQIRMINEHDCNLWHSYAEKNNWRIYFQKSDDDNKNIIEKTDVASKNSLHYQLLNGIQINFSNNDFIQINQHVNISMVEQALDWLKPQSKDKILDLFCGLGNFSLPLAQKANHVVGVEGVQTMVDKAIANAKFNHIDNCSFFQADLNSEWLSNQWAKNKFTKVLLDPARAGAELAIEQVVQLNIPSILYVSCDPATLARDSQVLLLKGYKIEKIGMVDMFSQTKHVETMVLFNR
jgi:23S rRNA (uracil1939-C5)-methyltransferase